MSRNVVLVAVLWCVGSMAVPLTRTANGQIVSGSPGGGVHVRAPFVRVDVYPYGGVSVRAPFAAVDVPGRPYYYGRGPMVIERHVAEPSFPTAQELAVSDDASLQRSLRSIADRLQQRLGRFNTGSTWQRYLRLPDEILGDSSAVERREALTELAERFHDVAAEPKYAMIAELPAFAAMRAALIEATSRFGDSPEASGARAEELPDPSKPVQ